MLKTKIGCVMCDIPFGVVFLNGKLTYVDALKVIDEANKHCNKDFSGAEDQIHHGIIAMCLFGAEAILDVGLPNLYQVRGRIQEEGNKISIWYGFTDIFSKKRTTISLKMALRELVARDYGVTKDSIVLEHVDEKPGKSMSVKLILE